MYGLVFWLFYTFVQSPLLLALAIVVLTDELVFGFRARLLRRWRGDRRIGKLARLLAQNPHDRRARFELAELLVDRGRFARAVETLKPNLEFGEHDSDTLLLMGRACSGAGHFPRALVFLEEARANEPQRTQGATDLALGEHWLRAGEAARSEESLLLFCKQRPGSIEGYLRLSRAQAALGKGALSSASRLQAWRNYAEAPRFIRKRDRLWAFRVRPLRTLILGSLFAALTITIAVSVPPLFTRQARGPSRPPATREDTSE